MNGRNLVKLCYKPGGLFSQIFCLCDTMSVSEESVL